MTIGLRYSLINDPCSLFADNLRRICDTELMKTPATSTSAYNRLVSFMLALQGIQNYTGEYYRCPDEFLRRYLLTKKDYAPYHSPDYSNGFVSVCEGQRKPLDYLLPEDSIYSKYEYKSAVEQTESQAKERLTGCKLAEYTRTLENQQQDMKQQYY